MTFYCDKCGDTHLKEDGVQVGGEWYCEDCIEEVAVKCDGCDEWILNDDSYETEEGYTYCKDCFDDNAFECSECGEFHEKDKGHFDEETENWYCDNCYEELLEERKEDENEDENEEEE